MSKMASAQLVLVNPDIAEERAKCTFPVSELTNFLDGGPSGTEERHEIERKFAQDPSIARYADLSHLSTDDYYSKAVEASLILQRKSQELDIASSQVYGSLQCVRHAHIGSIAFPSGDPMELHSFMFMPAIMYQGTEEQKAKWLPLAEKNVIRGTYCLTELGHGSNIRGIETTATYDPQTEEFVLHSPTLSSIKCWAGGLGRTCNAAIIVAQLYVKGTCHGIHAFYLQFRSLEDHIPLPGVKVGELGPKMGVNALDNGFLKLDNIRIPRTNMLMKNAQVLPDGTYVKPKRERAGYGTLIMARSILSLEMTLLLAQAATIGVRYSAVRRQGGGEPETKILDYQTQQYKLLPQVAMAYAGILTLRQLQKKIMVLFANPTAALAAEVHALSSGLKAICTQNAASGIEQCRLACGGLGYLQASRLPFLYGYTTASCTFDGENTVLLLQTARFLIKSCHALKNGEEASPMVGYLGRTYTADLEQLLVFADVLEEMQYVFQKTTTILTFQVTKRLATHAGNDGKSVLESWNSQSVDLVKCARLHTQTAILQEVSKTILCEEDMSQSLKSVLRRLFEFLALHWIRESAGDFIQYGGVSPSKMADLNARLFVLLDQLRPDILGLVDAFDFCDESLQSVIGCKDGRVYERVYDYLIKLPSNQVQVHPVFEKLLRPKNLAKL